MDKYTEQHEENLWKSKVRDEALGGIVASIFLSASIIPILWIIVKHGRELIDFTTPVPYLLLAVTWPAWWFGGVKLFTLLAAWLRRA